MILANVIFPAPSAVYVATIFFPLAAVLAIVTELSVFAYFQKGVLSRWHLFGVVLGVNLFSWIVGVVFSLFLPSGLVPELVDARNSTQIITTGPYWNAIAIGSFCWTCLLSFALEYFALWALRARLRFRRLALCVGVANIASYLGIAAVVAIHLHFDLF
jgi:hypothetical protein